MLGQLRRGALTVMLDPFLFSSDRLLVASLAGSGPDRVGAVVVDWEHQGKQQRQAGASDRIGIGTQINRETAQDLSEVVAIAQVPVLCRLNRWTHASAAELETAIAHGAAEVLLPMVRTIAEVEAAIDAARGRLGIGILVETVEATEIARSLAKLPLTRVFVGLMDLALERGSSSIFDAVHDGTVERMRREFDAPFGFAGLTVPGGGRPVPIRQLAAEMVRLGCEFSFLRRSFISDSGHAPLRGLREIKSMLSDLEARTADETERDHRRLMATLAAVTGTQTEHTVATGRV